MPTPNHQNALHPVTITAVPGLTIEGFSISGVATWIVVPELDVMFDAGECPLSAVPVNRVLLSHIHGDHSRCLPRHWQLRQMMRMSPATYYVPSGAITPFREIVRIEAEMSGEPVEQPDFRTLPEDAGVRTPFGKGVWVTAFPVEHRVESFGYTVGRTVQKLRPEYAALTGPEIGALRKGGTVVTDPVDTPQITFIGDCTGASLRANKHIWNSRVVIIEATYVEPEDRVHADEHMHTHLDDVVTALTEAGPSPACEAVILKHFSLKHHPDRIRDLVETRIPPEWYDRVHILLPDPE